MHLPGSVTTLWVNTACNDFEWCGRLWCRVKSSFQLVRKRQLEDGDDDKAGESKQSPKIGIFDHKILIILKY